MVKEISSSTSSSSDALQQQLHSLAMHHRHERRGITSSFMGLQHRMCGGGGGGGGSGRSRRSSPHDLNSILAEALELSNEIERELQLWKQEENEDQTEEVKCCSNNDISMQQ